MITIDELYSELKQLTAKVEKLRKEQKNADTETTFREIEVKANRYPISGHPMSGADEHTQDMYMLLLMSVIVLDPEKYTESFMTFYRIAAGMGYKGDTDRLMISAQSMKFETLDEITRLFLNDDKKLLLLLECMLIAGQFDKVKRKAMEYIAQLTELLKTDKQQLVFLTNLARVVLTQNLAEYKTDILNNYDTLFDCYLAGIEYENDLQLLYAKGCITINNCSYPIKKVAYNNDIITITYQDSGFLLFDSTELVKQKPPKKFVYQLLSEEQISNISDNKEYVLYGVASDNPLAAFAAKRKLKEAYSLELRQAERFRSEI